MRHKSFVVFLDVDGVLNTRTTCKHTPDGYTGIDDARVSILSQAISKYGDADIVLTSDWKDMKPTDDDYVYLESKLDKYGLSISGKAPGGRQNRGGGIVAYLEEHPEIEEYVILDDCKFDFEDYKNLWERLLLTDGIENAKFVTETPAVEALVFMDYIKMF